MNVIRAGLLATLIALSGCGGGTSGTGSGSDLGIERVFRGQVTDAQGIGVAGASVVVLETGDSTESAANGDFSLVTALTSSSASVEVTKDGSRAEQRLESLSSTTSVIRLDVELAAAASSISDFEFSVLQINGGPCAGAFSAPNVFSFVGNADPLVMIDQVVPLPSPTACTVQVRTAASGTGQAGVPFQIVLVRPQDVLGGSHTPDEIVGRGVTGPEGVGEAEFPFFSGPENQGYYVVEAPAGAPGETRLGVVINPAYRF